MLGHVVPFKYCRTVKEGMPCQKVLDCWFEMIPIQKFVDSNYSEEQVKAFLSPPKPKMVTLIDLIEKAKKSAENK